MATQRFAAFLRGVSPMNLKMKALTTCLQAAGLTDVHTLLASGNVLFSAPPSGSKALERKLEQAMEDHLHRSFLTFVRAVTELRALVKADPFGEYKLPGAAKRVVTFLRKPPSKATRFLIEQDGAVLYGLSGLEVFSAYVVNDKGPVFMELLKRTFGEDITTRTWGTLTKAAADAKAQT